MLLSYFEILLEPQSHIFAVDVSGQLHLVDDNGHDKPLLVSHSVFVPHAEPYNFLITAIKMSFYVCNSIKFIN